jgi:2-polyprenyl-3-methyl-5-hydroxy-6-metoxy-1,4-benzoquinol methylase
MPLRVNSERRHKIRDQSNTLSQSDKTQAGSPERFGYSWDKFHSLSAEQEEQFRRWTALVNPDSGWRGKTVLDVGCGAGRNSYWVMRYGASDGLAIDADESSLAWAKATLADFKSLKVENCSIFDLNIENRFDIAFSIGVIHHLEDPAGALRKMTDAVKPCGEVLIWVYGRENMEFYVNVLTLVRNAITSRLPMPLLTTLTYLPAAALWIFLRIWRWELEYFRLLRGFPFKHLHHIVLDQLLPNIAQYWRQDEVRTLMENAGLNDIRLEHVNGMSWAAIGRKPASP